MVRQTGRCALLRLAELGHFSWFVVNGYRSVFGARHLAGRCVRSLHEQGVRCLPVILIVGVFTGLVLGLQGYHTLSRFGSTGLLGSLVALTLTRELAPVLAALMLVGQAGSALTAELGIQRNSEQIDALETMGVNPLGYLVAPRLLAALAVFPIMSGFFVWVGLLGGALAGTLLLGLEPGVYWASVYDALDVTDVRECLTKAVAFGALSSSLCAYHGFHAHRHRGLTGARAVSAATTRAVVGASIAILATDYAITSFFV